MGNQLVHAARDGDSVEVEKLFYDNFTVETEQLDALWEASRCGNTEVVRFLVENGVPLDSKNFPTGRTPICAASEHGHIETVMYLMEAGADPHIATKTRRRGKTAMNITKSPEIRSALRYMSHKRGLDPTYFAKLQAATLRQDKAASKSAPTVQEKNAVICQAAKAGDLATVKRLVNEKGVSVHCKGRNGDTLYEAATAGKLNVVRFLVESGAIVNAQHRNGYTTLNAASQYGLTDVVLFLLDAGADPYIVNHSVTINGIVVNACNAIENAKSDDIRCVILHMMSMRNSAKVDPTEFEKPKQMV